MPLLNLICGMLKNNVKRIANSPASIELKCEDCDIGGDSSRILYCL